jgi:transposase
LPRAYFSCPFGKVVISDRFPSYDLVEQHLWTFLRAPGIEPTNNAVERAPRHAVLWRKSSGGTASARGSRFVERVLSVVATCRQQGRDVVEFLTRCLRAQVTGGVLPCLLAPRTIGDPL